MKQKQLEKAKDVQFQISQVESDLYYFESVKSKSDIDRLRRVEWVDPYYLAILRKSITPESELMKYRDNAIKSLRSELSKLAAKFKAI